MKAQAATPGPGPARPGLAGRPWWPWARRALLTLFLAGVAWLIVRQAREIEWAQVWVSVRAFAPGTLALAALLAALSLGLYSSFDLLGRRYSGHRLRTRDVLTVTFISYVFNLNLGALIGGFAFRYRLYSRLGLDMGAVTRILSLSMLTNWLGYLLLAGSLFALHPLPLPPAWKIDMRALQWLGLAMVAAGLAYLLLCLVSQRRHWQLRGHGIALPPGRMALLQAVMGPANWLLLGALMYTLMPAGLDFATVTTVLLLAAMAGVVTHVPAGLGVLETVFLTLLSHRVPRHDLLAALLAYRLLYYLAPLALAAVLYVLTELRARRLREAAAAPAGAARPPA